MITLINLIAVGLIAANVALATATLITLWRIYNERRSLLSATT